ncbi:MAG: tyrosine recombinase XerC [Pseudomonadota bacterium]
MAPERDPLVARFLGHLGNERRLSAHTQRAYERDLTQFRDWARDADIADWRSVEPAQVKAFAAARFRRGISPRSISRALSALRAFYRYLLREHEVTRNPADGVTAPRATKRLPGTLDSDTMARLLDIQGDEPLTRRDRAMLELLYSSGLRLAEIVGLNIRDIDLADRTVRVTGKGSKQRIVPVGRKAIAALRTWLAARGNLAGDTQAVFVAQHGGRIGARSVQRRVAHWARQQGIDARVHPHLFRHSCATHVLESSRDLRGVQELLGHADIATTQIYTHLDFQHLAQIYDEAHPRAKRRRD